MNILSLALAFLLFTVFACAPPTATPSIVPDSKPDSGPAVIDSRPEWQVKIDNIIKAARSEGKVVLYTTAGGDVRTELSKAFKARYGVDLEHVPGRGADLANKIITERRAGLYLADAYMAGATTQINVLKPEGFLDRMDEYLVLPEVIDEKIWLGGKLPFLDRDRNIVSPRASVGLSITINTNLAKEEEIKSYRDLLNPKWKSKIVMQDPTIAGTTQSGLAKLGYKIMGWDYVRELAKQEPVLLRNDRLLVEWVARGRYPIGYELKSDTVKEFIIAGAPLKGFNPVEGTFLGSGSAYFSIMKRSAHPNAIKLFANWLLSQEGQTVYSRANLTASARLDVPTNHLPPEELISPTAKFYPEDEEFYLKKPEFDQLLVEIFASLLAK